MTLRLFYNLLLGFLLILVKIKTVLVYLFQNYLYFKKKSIWISLVKYVNYSVFKIIGSLNILNSKTSVFLQIKKNLILIINHKILLNKSVLNFHNFCYNR